MTKKQCPLFYSVLFLALLEISTIISSCNTSGLSTDTGLKVVAAESFIADIAQNIAGDRLKIETLLPLGVDPHEFEPTPQDVTKVAESNILIINGAGLETWLNIILQNAGGNRQVIEASKGLSARTPRPEEMALLDPAEAANDPHFWLNPNNVIQYVENIRDGLIQADPNGKDIYTLNAENYIQRLRELDDWIKQQVSQIPANQRLLITNHESLGYFADQYGFQIIGTIIPSTSTEASPSAQDIAHLIEKIKSTGAPAIFLETGINPQLADQISQETGINIVKDLYTHFLSDPQGPASDYITMMKYDTTVIVEALK
jgi:ABC-type Zn uptake system ZnuABC Zn-binding protein ZnuA